MKLKLLAVLAGAVVALPAMAADVTYRKDVAPMLEKYCADCHSAKAGAPTVKEFDDDKARKEQYKKDKVGPRNDTYETVLQLIAYPDAGAFMRRLDDGTSQYAGGKPGNMYKYLCEKGNDAECAANLKVLKAWVGEGGWNLNRFKARGDVPAITKEQLDKLQLKY
ncbi:MAG: cytochrome C [Rhodoferax sp.]|nr:cytochrome C [Betaproteobacteria bacterium]NCN96642.1 cytochrome C [Rhodoferax sp.]OIP13156.1 MAG: cytochrome C [Comamonadaceae bacterium CG2_30_57_122]PIZ22153.1 MAG: cytochrome C [Comamonadaceae bacterium CG_4_10_14_0_8_um_filter_57_29]PJC22282.1 MAG: cytochrome C [Comamonadaceae bacterium CG_4_9_14_0_8_um_filter_57_21]